MARTERNALCPCGSGKKTKHCCGERASLYPPSPGRPMHLLDERLVDDMLDFAESRFGQQRLTEARQAYFLEEMEFEPEQLQFFMPWAVHHWRIEGRPVREWFLAEQGGRLTQAERDWLLAQGSAVVTLWEVQEVRKGEGVVVTDLLGGETCFVHEVTGSQTLRVWDTVLGRVVSSGGVQVFCGIYPRTLLPIRAAEVVWEARELLGVRDKWVPRAALAREGMDLKLIHLWMGAVLDAELASTVMPSLTNTDGDPLLLTVDHFTFAPAERERVLEGLLRLKGAEVSVEGMPTSLMFLKKGNAIHKSWKSTIVGNAQVEEARLRLETNSVRRADKLRKSVEQACAGLLAYQTREHSSPEAFLPPRGSLPEPKGEERWKQAPEILAKLREFKAQHYAAWLDSPLPALEGKTPRESARTETGRRMLEALLKELEYRESRLPQQQRVDLSPLRAELGFPT